jgi:copper chaperone
METKTYTFKTNINCAGCVAAITPTLNAELGSENWLVDTAVSEKVLTIKTNSKTESELMNIVEKAGYKIEKLQS